MADGGARIGGNFEDSAVGRRLALCAELARLKRGEDGASVKTKVKVRNRAHAILRTIIPGELGAGKATDALQSMEAATRFFRSEIEAARHGSDAAKVRAGLLLLDLQKMAGQAVTEGWRPTHGNIVWPEVPGDFIRQDPESQFKADSPAMPIVSEAKALGALPEGLAEAAKREAGDGKHLRVSWEQIVALAPEKAAELEEAQLELTRAREALVRSQDDSDSDALFAKYKAANDRFGEIQQALRAVGLAEGARRKEAIGAVVADYMASIMESSDVTEERAAEWASQQVVITAAAAKRLKKQGYSPEQVIKDAAEFYRFTRGRVEKVVIDSAGDRRANATSIDAHGTAGRINLGSTFDKRVLWHELGHHVEADPVAAMAARLFIRLRSDDGGKTHKLRKLTGYKGYRSDEVAVRNGFFNPYVGKVYKWGVTEVFSMGIESFSSPYLLATRIGVDPETFEFVVGYLRSPKSTLQRLHLAMRQEMREGDESATAESEDTAAAAIKREAAKVPDFIPSKTLPEDVGEWARSVWFGEVVGYLSSAHDGIYYIMSLAKRRNPRTGRVGKVFQFSKLEKDASRMPMARTVIPAGEPEIARLFLWYWRQNGIEPSYESLAGGNVTVSGE